MRLPAGLSPRHDMRLVEDAAVNYLMDIEKIKVKTEAGQVLDVVVLNKRADHITVVLGEGPHSVKCDLSPTRNGLAYVGSIMGREIVYERSRDKVKADIEIANPNLHKPRAR